MHDGRVTFLAALLTPTAAGRELDLDALGRNIEFVLDAGADGVCVNGATGEYPLFPSAQRRAVVESAAAFLQGRGRLIAGIGAASLNESAALGRHALDSGADALLLPPPYFFRYEPQDFASFYREAAARLDGPIVIYNIPVFASPVEPEWIARLTAEEPNIVGVKDSSGSLASLTALRRQGAEVRWIGKDERISEALSSGAANGLISGIAGVFPEVVGAVAGAHGAGADHADADAVLQEIARRIESLPAPWGLKLLAQCRGLGEAHFALPVSTGRRQELDALKEWFEAGRPAPASAGKSSGKSSGRQR